MSTFPVIQLVDAGVSHLDEVKGLFSKDSDADLPYHNLTIQLQEVQSHIERLEEELDGLFGIEKVRADQITAELGEPRLSDGSKPTKLYKQEEELLGRIALLKSSYSTWMDLGPLRWRNRETQMPVFALMRYDFPTFTFEKEESFSVIALQGYELKIEPELPKALAECFEDILKVLPEPSYTTSSRRKSISRAWAQFSGTIPKTTRQKMNEAIDSELFTRQVRYKSGETVEEINIFLLVEVEAWKIDQVPSRLVVDPIVVGWSRYWKDRLWYIDSFDITPLENTITLSDS